MEITQHTRSREGIIGCYTQFINATDVGPANDPSPRQRKLRSGSCYATAQSGFPQQIRRRCAEAPTQFEFDSGEDRSVGAFDCDEAEIPAAAIMKRKFSPCAESVEPNAAGIRHGNTEHIFRVSGQINTRGDETVERCNPINCGDR